jgi:hypothetical protein
MPQALAAFCGTHAQAPAVATCRRCGLFLCDACVVLAGDESYCQSCAARREAPPAWGTKAAALLPIVSLGCSCFFWLGGYAGFLGLAAPPLWAFGLAMRIFERRKKHESIRSQAWLRAASWALVIAGIAIVPVMLLIVSAFVHAT